MIKPKSSKLPCAAIITAIPVEFEAVMRHLQDVRELTPHKSGTIYHEGKFVCPERTWLVDVATMAGMGNILAGIHTERAIAQFDPDVVIFVGVAGGIKDVKIGDIVVAEKVYDYESGKVGSNEIYYRPNVGLSSSAIYQRAVYVSITKDWQARIHTKTSALDPRVFPKPIATGEKVLTSKKSELFNTLKTHFNDAIAIEMEGAGFLTAVQHNTGVQALIVRGISDLLDNKELADKGGSQTIAADHASAFAFEVLAKFRF